MSKIVIGKAGGHNVSIDLGTLLTTRALLTADSGGGKTFTLKRIIEQAFGKIQIIVVDPEGEFSPLREKLDFVLVGKGGETPADVRSAALVAQTLLRLRVCAICDIYEMKPLERHAWVRAFLTGLIEAPKEVRHPCLVIVDEAHMFCPEKGKGESEASDAMRDLCTRGRKRLLCPLFSTQRLATLSKDASSMLLNRMIGPTFEDLNRKRAADVLSVAKGDEKAFFKQIQTLEPGNFFCLGRAITKERILVHIGPIETPHGQDALKYEMKPPPAPEKIKAMLSKLADLPKAAEEQAKTVAEFRSEIRSLKAQLRAQPQPQVSVQTKQIAVADPRAIERAVREAQKGYAPLRAMLEEAMRVIVKVEAFGFEGTAIKPEQIQAALEATAKEIGKLAKATLARRESEFGALKQEANRVLLRMKKLLEAEKLSVRVDVKHNEPFSVRHVPPPPARAPRSIEHAAESDGALTPQQRKILAGLAEFEALGQTEVPRSWVGAAAGQSFKSSTFEKYVARLRALGLIDYAAGKRIRLTDAGRDAAPASDAPLSTEEIQKRCMKLLTPQQQALLNGLIEVHPEFISREELGEKAGQSSLSSTFEKYLAALRSSGMIEYGPNKTVKCADWLFID